MTWVHESSLKIRRSTSRVQALLYLDISTCIPDLGGMLTVPSPTQDIAPSRDSFRDGYSIFNRKFVHINAACRIREGKGRGSTIRGPRVVLGADVRAGPIGEIKRCHTARAIHPAAMVSWSIMESDVIVAWISPHIRKRVEPPAVATA